MFSLEKLEKKRKENAKIKIEKNNNKKKQPSIKPYFCLHQDLGKSHSVNLIMNVFEVAGCFTATRK